MNNVRSLINEMGKTNLAESLKCGDTALHNAASRGCFPSSWYPTVQKLAREKGITVPDHLFNWRQPGDVDSMYSPTPASEAIELPS